MNIINSNISNNINTNILENIMMMQKNMMIQMQNGMNNMNMQNDMNDKMGNLKISEYKRSNHLKIKIFFRFSGQSVDSRPIVLKAFLDEKVEEVINKFREKSGNYNRRTLKFIFNAKNLNPNLTCAEAGLTNKANVFVVNTAGVKGGGENPFSRSFWINEKTLYEYGKVINIKFIKISKNIYDKINNNNEIIGLLKLCFLKEMSQKISIDKIKKYSEIIYYIIKILSNGYIKYDPDNLKKNIKNILEKTKGNNIIAFSNYVDEIIDSNQLNILLNLLNKEDLIEMNNLKNLLSNYNNCIKFFNKEFAKAQKESIFEFSIISLVIIEREDFEKFEKERENCPNRVERILFHGTNIEPASSILTGLYRKSLERKKAINGQGVYFTDLLDYAWYYGGEAGNRANFSGIPEIDDTFTIIINYIYYDKKGYMQVNDSKRTPGKNQINFAYAGARSERISKPDKNKFTGTEYVVYELDQICPFMSAKIQRVEYCVIWRDDNFSSKPVYNNKFDEKFKSFLKERLKYINQNAKYNIYPCETSEEALGLVNRKKYNKIILISNVGTDFRGKKFIEKARKIIGNNVIVLFLAYKSSHLDWIKKYENALFSNDPRFYEEYLRCFDDEDEDEIKNNIKSLIEKMERHYKVKFNFNEKYLDYPLFLEDGKYSDLTF
jgi:hypothetical protein